MKLLQFQKELIKTILRDYEEEETIMEFLEMLENNLFFAKVKPSAKIPKKRNEDAGYDIYACFDESYLVIDPGETKFVPTGIASAFDESKYIQLEERGSTGSKGIKRSAGVIDSGYRGEWFVALTNTRNIPVVISKISEDELNKELWLSKPFLYYPYEKAICQAIVHEVPKMSVHELPYVDLLDIESARGTGALGSSGR